MAITATIDTDARDRLRFLPSPMCWRKPDGEGLALKRVASR